MIDEYLINAIKERLEEAHVYGVSIVLQMDSGIYDCEDWLTIILEVKGVEREYVYHLDDVLFDSCRIDISHACKCFIDAVKEKALEEFLERKEVEES